MICACYFFLFFKQKTAYEMRISDWSSDVCSSDLLHKPSAYGRVEPAVVNRIVDVSEDVIVEPSRQDRRPVAVGGSWAEWLAAQYVISGKLGSAWAVLGVRALRRTVSQQIGRASCRGRVCQYV